jgi:hypothetical protein
MTDFPQVVENMQAFIADRYSGWVARSFEPGRARWVCHHGDIEFTVTVETSYPTDAEPIDDAQADALARITRIHPIGAGSPLPE